MKGQHITCDGEQIFLHSYKDLTINKPEVPFHHPGSLQYKYPTGLVNIIAVGWLAVFGNRMNGTTVSHVFSILVLGVSLWKVQIQIP